MQDTQDVNPVHSLCKAQDCNPHPSTLSNMYEPMCHAGFTGAEHQGLTLYRTRGGAASKPIDHMWSTQHHVRHGEALIWIEFRVKQLTLMPANLQRAQRLWTTRDRSKRIGDSTSHTHN